MFRDFLANHIKSSGIFLWKTQIGTHLKKISVLSEVEKNLQQTSMKIKDRHRWAMRFIDSETLKVRIFFYPVGFNDACAVFALATLPSPHRHALIFILT